MTKSDDFFDITGASEPEKPPGEASRDVDFDVFGGAEAPAAPAADITSEFTETLVVSASRVVEGKGVDLNLDGESPAAAPPPRPAAAAPAAAPAPASTPAETPATGGNGKWVMGALVLIAIAAAVWWLLKS